MDNTAIVPVDDGGAGSKNPEESLCAPGTPRAKKIETRRLPDGAVEAKLGDITIVVRENDGYVNATRLCDFGGKMFADWYRRGSASEFLEVVAKNTGMDIDDLVEV